jgi:predicted outer membrane lipoprotein
MSLFDLLFLGLSLAAAISLLAAVWLALRKQFGRAGRVLLRLLLCAGVYMAVVVLVSLVSPRRFLKADATQCFDDWCIGVAEFRRVPESGGVAYRVDLRVSSRARRVSQRERNVVVYLTDEQGKRYDPVADAATPIGVLLRPRESVVTSRSFLVPAEAKDLGLVVAHEGGFPIGWFIIGYDTWFQKPAILRLQ